MGGHRTLRPSHATHKVLPKQAMGNSAPRPQGACLCLDEQRRVLLISSRQEKGSWVVPKGYIAPRFKGAEEAAVSKAAEEAGVMVSQGQSLAILDDQGASARVEIFVFKLDQQLEDWPQRNERQRRWVSYDEAMNLNLRPWVRFALEHAKLKLGREEVEVESDAGQCDICMAQPWDTVFLCGHHCCHTCAERLQTCHQCRQPMRQRIHVYH